MRSVALVCALFVAGCGSSDAGGADGTRGSGTKNEGEILVESETLVLDLEADSETLFFVSNSLLHAIAASGGSVRDVGGADGEMFALDATHAYFPGNSRGTVTKLPKAGGDAFPIVSGEKEPVSIGVDEGHVYWGNWSSYDTAPVADGTIARAALDGSSLEVLATAIVYPRGMALDRDNLYFVSAGEYALYRLPKSGGTPVALAVDLYDASPPVFADGVVYVRTRATPNDPEDRDAILRIDAATGTSDILVSERYGIDAIAVYGGFVYYTRSGGSASCSRPSGVVRRVPATGGTAQDLVVRQSDPSLISVNESGIYWTNGSSSSHACKAILRAGLP